MTVSDILSSAQKLGKSVVASAALLAGLSLAGNAQATSINALPGSFNLAPDFSVMSMPFVSDHDVESFLGLSSGELDALFGTNLISGTGFKNNWVLDAGDTLSFDYVWSDAGIADSYGVITVDGELVSIIDAGSSFVLHDLFSWEAATTDTYEIGMGMVSSMYFPFSGTALMAFNYQVTESSTSGASAVPIPSTLLLMGLGLIAIPCLRRKKR
jgi:hypothetical protein